MALSKTELAALDLLIASMEEEQAALGPNDPAAFIGNIIRVTRRVTRVAIQVTPVATRFIGGASAMAGTAGLAEAGELPPEVSLEDLIALRDQLAGSGDQGSGGQGSSGQTSRR